MGTGSFLWVKQSEHGADLLMPGCEWVRAMPLPFLYACTGVSFGDLYLYNYSNSAPYSFTYDPST